MGWFDDVVDFVGDAADAVADVASDVVNGVADAVAEIPVVGDVVEAAAPLAGMIGTVVGGPIGGAIGGVVSDAFSADGFGGGGMFDFVDDAIGAIGGPLLGPIGGVAGDLLGGGSLIDAAGSVLTGGLSDIGGLGDLAGQVLGGGDLGDLAGQVLGGGGLGDLAGQVLGGGGLGDLAGQVLGGGDLGDLAGQVLGGGGLGDLAGQVLGGGDLGGILGQAGSVLGGLGLGDLGSAAQGIIGDCMPDLSDAGGWLGNLPDVIPGAGDGGFELPFGLGTFPSIPDLSGPIGAAGGDWLGHLAEQAGQVADQIPGLGGGWFDSLGDNLKDTIAHIGDPNTPGLGQGTAGDSGTFGQPGDFGGTSIDDLIGQLPGVGDGEGSVQEKLQQLAENGSIGDALGNLSSNELTQLVSHLVSPPSVTAPTGIDDDMMMPIDGSGMDDATKAVVFGGQDPDDVLGAGTDDLGLDTTAAGMGTPTDTSTTDVGADVGADALGTAATSGLATDSGVDDFNTDMGAAPPPMDAPAPVAAPEPEPSDFSQAIAQADAVEESFDSMFEDLG